MGVVEAVRRVLWARHRQPDQVAYLMALGHERFAPPELLDQAREAEQAGFDAVCCSDHLAPRGGIPPLAPRRRAGTRGCGSGPPARSPTGQPSGRR